MKKDISPNKGGLHKRIRSFGFAFTGIYELVKSEPNARIHLLATMVAVAAGFYFDISLGEWLAVTIVIGMVWMAEAFNTVVEKLVDHLFPHRHETARLAKDISAGAVLLASIAALVCGLIVFGPRVALLLF
jgi:diacylglycerol kinase (ATP)